MFIVTIDNGGISTQIHGNREKVLKGNIVKGINSIDSFSFSILPSNVGFDLLNEFTTLIKVYNTNKKRYEYYGRVLYSSPSMASSGLIQKDISCESYFGFLCDSTQTYVQERNWTVIGLLQHIVDTHNAQIEDYKRFTIGVVTVTDPNNNLYCGIQRGNTWNTIKSKLIDKLGGELRFRVEDGTIYLDYLVEIGEMRTTAIALSKNMKSITQEKDPTAYVTRLIPYGHKLTVTNEETGETVETEERLGIESVNNGIAYIDDEQAINKYGLHIDYKEWDDVTEPLNLLNKGKNWLEENNRVLVKYSVTALDLSLLGLDIDDFDVHNWHPLKNALLGIDDTARIIKKNIDICNEMQSTIEVGDNFKTLSDMQLEQAGQIKTATTTIERIESNYVTNEKLSSETLLLHSLINQTVQSITATVSQGYVSKSEDDEYKSTIETQLAMLADEIVMKFTTATEQIVSVDGVLQSKFTELYKYISYSEDGITIGSGNNSITLQLDNENGIVFRRNGIPFGLWDGNNFYTGNIVVRLNERAQFGNFAFVPRSDGSLSFLKVGG
mgnify:CR=1 FL=1